MILPALNCFGSGNREKGGKGRAGTRIGRQLPRMAGNPERMVLKGISCTDGGMGIFRGVTQHITHMSEI
jgi:hypothetical protein